jgi:dolichol-phosphate mannosyltransferase
MYFDNNWAVIVPMANEEQEFDLLVNALKDALNRLRSGTVYFIIDKASKDRTLELSQALSQQDSRFITVFAPENKNVVDAYLRGYREAYNAGHEFIIEMDAGLSHDPRALPMFLRVLNEGNECAFGSRFINGGSTADSAWKRRFLSKFGTILSTIFLGTKMKDMTSGYQGFHRSIVEKFLAYPLKSKAHFYQTELRYLLRYSRYMEVPIHYRAPSPSVSEKAIKNSIACLIYYTKDRFFGKKIALIQPH